MIRGILWVSVLVWVFLVVLDGGGGVLWSMGW